MNIKEFLHQLVPETLQDSFLSKKVLGAMEFVLNEYSVRDLELIREVYDIFSLPSRSKLFWELFDTDEIKDILKLDVDNPVSLIFLKALQKFKGTHQGFRFFLNLLGMEGTKVYDYDYVKESILKGDSLFESPIPPCSVVLEVALRGALTDETENILYSIFNKFLHICVFVHYFLYRKRFRDFVSKLMGNLGLNIVADEVLDVYNPFVFRCPGLKGFYTPSVECNYFSEGCSFSSKEDFSLIYTTPRDLRLKEISSGLGGFLFAKHGVPSVSDYKFIPFDDFCVRKDLLTAQWEWFLREERIKVDETLKKSVEISFVDDTLPVDDSVGVEFDVLPFVSDTEELKHGSFFGAFNYSRDKVFGWGYISKESKEIENVCSERAFKVYSSVFSNFNYVDSLMDSNATFYEEYKEGVIFPRARLKAIVEEGLTVTERYL